MRFPIRRSAHALAVAALLAGANAGAVTFDLDYGDGITGTLNTVVTLGAGLRMQDRASNLVGKANLNPAVCGGVAQSCQGVLRDQLAPAQTLAAAPGQAYLNADDGNWNYDRGDLTQAVFKVTQDLSLSMGDYGFFAKWLYFYDFVNNDFEEFHPNWITEENRDRVGSTGGDNTSSFERSYGPGEPTRTKRSNGEVLRQIGTDLQMFDYYVYGTNTLPFTDDKILTWKIGNQTVNWGESTVLVINSINQVNPVNANNLFRVGFDLSELFQPRGMAFLSFEPFTNATLDMFYAYEWKPLEIPAPGSYFSFADIGSYDAIDYASISFGGPAEDPERCGTAYSADSGCGVPLNNPLSGLTSTSTTIRRLRDNDARDGGEFGFALKYFAENFNNGTEFGFYFMNYHSQLPYVSFFSTRAACARAEGSAAGMDTTNITDLFTRDCPDLPIVQNPSPIPAPCTPGTCTAEDARGATSNAVPIDTVKFLLEYPEDLQLYGVSFNTTLGDWSLQGELAYRPDMPLQIDNQDLTFHALGPMLARCHDAAVGCDGSAGPNESDFVPYPGTGITPYNDTFDLGLGVGVGSARSFPSFVGSWRGVAPGETPPESYIRGWEYFDVYQLNLGATYVQGATETLTLALAADQIIWLFEAGAQWVPDLPGTDRLQIEAPGTWYHASAGADGSMTGDYRQDCAHTVDCHFGGDGLRFNPHQENLNNYPDEVSWGYAIVNLLRYESVFPGISFQPITIWQHDVTGTSTDSANQFTEHRKDIIFLVETRYKEALSFNLGHVWFTGGGPTNLQRDRDQLFAYFKYQF